MEVLIGKEIKQYQIKKGFIIFAVSCSVQN